MFLANKMDRASRKTSCSVLWQMCFGIFIETPCNNVEIERIHKQPILVTTWDDVLLGHMYETPCNLCILSSVFIGRPHLREELDREFHKIWHSQHSVLAR